MHFTLASLATVFIMAALSGAKGPDKCPGPAAPEITLYAAYGNKRIAPLFVTPNGTTTLADSSSSATRFFLSGSMLFASVANTPHAFISFTNTGNCGPSGPLVFSTSNSNKCSSSSTFSFDGNYLQYSTPGSFELCTTGAAQTIMYDTNPASLPSICKPINIIQA